MSGRRREEPAHPAIGDAALERQLAAVEDRRVGRRRRRVRDSLVPRPRGHLTARGVEQIEPGPPFRILAAQPVQHGRGGGRVHRLSCAACRAGSRDGPSMPGALAAVASIAAMPLLQACARRWTSRIPATWAHGYCPICGAWPAFAEARGLERARRLRCARCGADWWNEWLRCPYCGVRDHTRLGALVPEAAGERRKVETCTVCRHYVKTLTTLTPTPAADVAVEDLATLDLDLVALAQGYVGVDGLGHAPTARVIPRPRRGLFAARR